MPSPDAYMDDDNWLLEEGDESSSSAAYVPETEWASMEEKFTNEGYREGITAGKSTTLQSGFNSGFAASVPLSRQLGNLRGRASAFLSILLFLSSQQPSSSKPSPIKALSSPLSSDPQLAETVARARAVVADLGRVTITDVLGVDEEAELHRIEHGEDPAEVFGEGEGERKKVRDLEKAMEGLLGIQESGSQRKDMGDLESRLDQLGNELGAIIIRNRNSNAA